MVKIKENTKLEKRRVSFKKKRKTIVFDLDQTLIYGEHLKKRHYYKFHFRPGLIKLLNKLSKYYNLAIFTASRKSYANTVINLIEKKNAFFTKIFTKDDTTEIGEHKHVKDLKKFNIPLKNILIIDDNPISYFFQKSNGLKAPSYTGEKNDKFLKVILNMLLKYFDEINMKKIIKNIKNQLKNI